MTSIEDLASRLGRLRFVELRLFEVMGGWVGSTPEPQVKALLAEQCYHHAWHADLWADRFPQGYGHDLAAATAAGGAHVGGWLDELAALEGTVARLAGLYRVVLPRLALGYRRWRSEADRVSDGPLLRWLELVSTDETADWQQGERLLQHAAGQPRLGRAGRRRSGPHRGGGRHVARGARRPPRWSAERRTAISGGRTSGWVLLTASVSLVTHNPVPREGAPCRRSASSATRKTSSGCISLTSVSTPFSRRMTRSAWPRPSRAATRRACRLEASGPDICPGPQA